MDWKWQDRAACKGLDPELFEYDAALGSNGPEDANPAAIAICSSCPVVAQCEAMRREFYGSGLVMAGTVGSHRGRKGAVSMSGRSGTWEEPARHGDPRRYRDCAAGPNGGRCEPCKDAHARFRHPDQNAGGGAHRKYADLEGWRTLILNKPVVVG